MKEIQLTQGKVAQVDDENFESLNAHKWYAKKKGKTFYAGRDIQADGKQTTHRMHWEVLGGKWIDHRDHDGLNNQKTNLRFCTNSENCMNRRKFANTSCTYKGVYFNKTTGKWRAMIGINGKRINLGYYVDETEAAKAYNTKAIELFGEFAYLNII